MTPHTRSNQAKPSEKRAQYMSYNNWDDLRMHRASYACHATSRVAARRRAALHTLADLDRAMEIKAAREAEACRPEVTQ